MSEVHARYELALGGVCPVPEVRGSASHVEIELSADSFERLAKHWRELPASSRPRLRGLTLARPVGERYQLVLDAGGKTPFLLITVAWPKDRTWPRLSAIWPYAHWWEDELRSFEGARIESLPGERGIAWRLN